MLDWITAARRHVVPSLDLTQFEASAKWNSLQETIQLARKLGVLYFIYNQVLTTKAAPMLAQFRKILLKGAPQHLRMTLAAPLQGCQIMADAIDFLKSYRELDSEKVVSLPIESKNYNRVKRQFKNIRPIGRQNTNLPVRSGPSQTWDPTRCLFGQAPSRPSFMAKGTQ